MPRLVLFGVIIVAAVIIYAAIDCLMSRANEVRSISKVSWMFTIVLIPVLGAVLWFLFGRPSAGPGPREPRRPSAPDDDPEFLRNLEVRRRQAQKEAELRAREAELRAKEEGRNKQNDDGKPGA
ncbi:MULTISPECIES: PLD nuclease N-terminal domain-containing protein [Arthrobacter]|uniref:PLD nuclease N-terminal domain-containing protein n=1 Tax=Arthrobacter jinronghuae TaxID=2964609 RepID=A0ABT1NN09_9MICC|nr:MULTISPECIES: PLDc N-terminal domain-containing protein [Arthrobacter]MCC9173505.1 PLD nuclease N-terminal domain-containing protein [Arthrobacter sp. zg-Y179]MCQ1949096.1 PLD nuclease N-terminal domain-containing protein [Arthrobacter jinronghuae]MCQ1952420.1 PLD nuclease N-terminal domain-containing protein [Arthrobacter sp. zg-Y238]MCQ1955461.1 PLD nuclease N-terminal domain-containing protein [Arthrobacter jinronghuae]UWX78114.1 PLD nuclease N-terminal domain-containing protein [Arthrob